MDTARITGLLAVAAKDRDLLEKQTAKARILLAEKYSQHHVTLQCNSWCHLWLIREKGLAYAAMPDNLSYLQGIHFYHDKPPYPRSGHYLQIALDQSFLLVRNDPVGLINLYCLKEKETTFFGTSSMDLACLARDFQLDEQGMLEFLTVGYPLLEHTFYHNISLLPAGCEWNLRRETLPDGIQKQYAAREETSEQDQVLGSKTLGRELRRAARDLATMGHPCCDLTGGFDSRGLLCGFLRAKTKFSTVVNGPPAGHDVLLARRIADRFDLDHHWNNTREMALPRTMDDVLHVLYLTDGEIEFSEYYTTSLIQKKTAKKGWITVNGSGGELFRGYWWEGERFVASRERAVHIPYLLKRLLLPGQNLDIFAGGKEQIHNMLASRIEQVLDEQGSNLPVGRRIDHLYLRLRMERWLARYYSATNKILPCCSPFLAAPVLSVALSLKTELKQGNRFFKDWLMRENRELATFPTDSGAPALPLLPSTVWSYRRYPLQLAKKAGYRLYGKFGGGRQISTAASLRDCFCQQVSDGTDILEFLAPGNMVSSVLFGESMVSLQKQNQSVLRQNTVFPPQLARIVTLELTLRQVQACRRKIRQSIDE